MTIAPTPPKTTAPVAPSRAAATPDCISPSSLDAEMAKPEMELIRPRISSGVFSWTSDPRTKTDTMSADPSTASMASERK